MSNPLLKVRDLGQSIWYDNIHRSLITSGELQQLVAEDGVAGVWPDLAAAVCDRGPRRAGTAPGAKRVPDPFSTGL